MNGKGRGTAWFWRRTSSPVWGAVLGLTVAAVVWPGPALSLFGLLAATPTSAWRPFHHLDLRLGDLLQKRCDRAQPAQASPVIIAGIDEKSEKRFGAIPVLSSNCGSCGFDVF